MIERSSGILLHPTCLAGRYGIGDLGPAAHDFVDWLAGAGCRLWQVLPLGPTGFGDSPYQSFSAYAGNPNLVSPDLLARDGYLRAEDLQRVPAFPGGRVDYGRTIPWKMELLRVAYQRFINEGRAKNRQEPFETFCQEQAHWLGEYALFMALKEAYDLRPWSDWPRELRDREGAALAEAGRRHHDTIRFYQFIQFIFFRQLAELRGQANDRDLLLIGDIPFYAAHDSVEVWTRPEYFKLDRQGRPRMVGGVPPDAFSETGQWWGNPVYRWEALRQDGYGWWVERIRAALRQVDLLRLDHFRGFEACWEIPAESPTAQHGQWVAGPGGELLRVLLGALKTENGRAPVIAEDLGLVGAGVRALREEYGFPGMKVLQFAFESMDPDNEYLPHNYPENCLAYTGTHDNDTTIGWYAGLDPTERDFVDSYAGYSGGSGGGIAWELIRLIWRSRAVCALAPLQDLLGLGSQARMNTPNTLQDNWLWRMLPGTLEAGLQEKLRRLNEGSGR